MPLIQNEPLCAWVSIMRGDRMLQSVLPTTKPLSCDQTLTCVRSALTRHVRSQKLLSTTLLILIRHWHPTSGHFAAQRPVSSRNLTSVQSVTGRFRSGFSLSGTLLELTGLWHPASGHILLSVRSHLDDFTLIK